MRSRATGRCDNLRGVSYSVETMPSKKAVSDKSADRAATTKPSRMRKNKTPPLSKKTVFRGHVFSVTSERVKEPGGIVVRRDIVRHGPSVVILAIDDAPEPRVLLERQYRHAAGDFLWELPAGSVDPGESPLAAARRELLEETGYRAKQWSRTLHFYPSPGFLDETMTIYLACGLTPGTAHPEEDELIAWFLMPLSQVLEMVLSGRIRDGKTIAGVLWLAESRRS
jgi:ADP-ribose diphosphatase